MNARMLYVAGVIVGLMGTLVGLFSEHRFKSAHPELIYTISWLPQDIEARGRDFLLAMVDDPVVLVLNLISLACTIVGCCLIARSGNRARAWSWMGLLSIYGIAVVAIISARRVFGGEKA